MKASLIIVMTLITAISCAQKFDVTEHFDPALPFNVIDMDHPEGKKSEFVIHADDSKHDQLLSWFEANKDNWEPSTNTHAGLIIVNQDDFHLLFYRNNDFIVVGYDDDDGLRHQFTRTMDSNDLRFLVDE